MEAKRKRSGRGEGSPTTLAHAEKQSSRGDPPLPCFSAAVPPSSLVRPIDAARATSPARGPAPAPAGERGERIRHRGEADHRQHPVDHRVRGGRRAGRGCRVCLLVHRLCSLFSRFRHFGSFGVSLRRPHVAGFREPGAVPIFRPRPFIAPLPAERPLTHITTPDPSSGLDADRARALLAQAREARAHAYARTAASRRRRPAGGRRARLHWLQRRERLLRAHQLRGAGGRCSRRSRRGRGASWPWPWWGRRTTPPAPPAALPPGARRVRPRHAGVTPDGTPGGIRTSSAGALLPGAFLPSALPPPAGEAHDGGPRGDGATWALIERKRRGGELSAGSSAGSAAGSWAARCPTTRSRPG
jgi:hypothetical protein